MTMPQWEGMIWRRNNKSRSGEERFRKLATHNFQWASNGADLFTNFEEVLVDTTLTNWEDNVNPIDDADKWAECFEEVM
jgi:hypothetical protein